MSNILHQHERRRAHRRRRLAEHGIACVRIRPGQEVELIDISAAGALVEGVRQMRPGSFVDVQVVAGGQTALLRGRVVRCSVARLHASGVCYRGAIGFERRLSWFLDEQDAEYAIPDAAQWAL